MKIKILLLPAIPLILAACSGKKQITDAKNGATIETAVADRDGSSFEKAIVINEKSGRPGVEAEYAYVKNKYPGSKMRNQQLSQYKGKPYDILNITTADGKDIAIYFDISGFFGKF